MDYLRQLVKLGYIDFDAVAIAQSERDPPAHGIGLRPVGERLTGHQIAREIDE